MKHRHFFYYCRCTKGISLLDLAIALIIIGVLSASIFAGKSMIQQASLQQTLTQIQSFCTAFDMFESTYQSFPGDYSYAQQMLHENASNGKGKGMLEGKGLTSQTSSLNAWQHLAYARLISFMPRDEEQPVFGGAAPSSSIGGGFTIESNPHGDMSGTWLILGQAHDGRGTGGLLTPKQVLFFVQKMTGNNILSPHSTVQARDGSDAKTNDCIKSDGQLNTSSKKSACTLYILLRN